MTRLVDIEQAVEAVRSSWLDGESATVAALRALQPAEPTAEEVERVTQAVFDNCVITKEGCRKIARAAIAAMKHNGGKER